MTNKKKENIGLYYVLTDMQPCTLIPLELNSSRSVKQNQRQIHHPQHI